MSRVVIIIYSIVLKMKDLGVPILPYFINKIFIRLLFGCDIGLGARIGRNVSLGKGGLGVVIHEYAIIGDNVSIGTCATIGGTTKKTKAPVIGNNTIISTGAKILGPIQIGNNCVIGANAVVVRNIPDKCLVVGVPGRIIKDNIEIGDYRNMD